MSSPVSELLVQESLCTDLFKTISESVDASTNDNPDVVSFESYSDDVIGQLLDRMIQILPPEERDIFGSSEAKNIEEIIEEANELIRTTTPLFSSSESDRKNVSTDLNKSSKESESPSNKDYFDIVSSAEKKNESDTISSSSESILLKESVNSITTGQKSTESDVDKSRAHGQYEIDRKNIESCEEDPVVNIVDKLRLELEEMPAAESSGVLEKMRGKFSVRDKDLTRKTTHLNNLSYPNSETCAQERIPTEIVIKEDRASIETIRSSDAGADTQLDILRQRYIAEVQEIKLSHSKEVYGLTEQINSLNGKIYKYQKYFKDEKNPDLKNQLEHFENEIKSQEQLLFGYEKENKKLCKEILTLKEVWKQRENQLIDEKQRLQNEVQGMVSKSTTESLEEQLKDARETIVKLQIELATYKSENKELEVTCERLRSENQRLLGELGNCHCDRTTTRRDTYSFLASNNVGAQIQELKNVISRKDIEIAQMNTTLGIMKGELSNRDLSVPSQYNQQLDSHSLTVSQLETALALERQAAKDLAKEKEVLLKENLDLKRQVKELESIVKRRQRSDSCFPVITSESQSSSRLLELEKELSNRQESLSALHSQFLNMQKKYEEHIQELEVRLKECRDELQTLKTHQKKEEANHPRSTLKKFKQGPTVVKEETHLLATIRGLRQEASTREKEINKLNKEMEELRQTNKRLQKEREKQLNAMPTKMASIREKANLRKVEKSNCVTESRPNTVPPNNNSNPLLFTELQESNLILKSKTKSLQEQVKRLEQDLLNMHNKRVHDMNLLQSEHELELSRLIDERAALLSQTSATELQGQVYTQQMVINHLKNRLQQMEELKNEVTLLRAERDHLEESLSAVNKKMCYLQTAQSPGSIQYKTLLAKLETLEKNQEVREQKLNAVRELLCRSTQGQGQCGGTCRDKLLDKNRQICYYRAQMDRILEAVLEIRRTK